MRKPSQNRPDRHGPRKQATSPELRDQCLDFLQRKFYPTHPIPFAKDRPRLLAWVVLWPAKWFSQRGVTVQPDRYLEIFSSVFMDGLRFGDLEKITYLPAWLATVIQSHFSHHGEEYYEAAKRERESIHNNTILKGILAGNMTASTAAPDPIQEMAQAARLLKPKKRAQKQPINAQLTML